MMIKGILTAVICCTVCPGAVALAADAEWPQVLARLKTTYSAVERDMQDMVMRQEMVTHMPEGKMSGDMTTWRKKNKFRSEFTMSMPEMEGMPAGLMGQMKTTVISDGEKIWMHMPMMGLRNISLSEGRQYLGDYGWWEAVESGARIAGSGTVNDRDCYEVVTENQDEAGFSRLWLDKELLVPIKMEYAAASEAKGKKRGSQQKSGGAEIVFLEYQAVPGAYHVPYRMEVFSDGSLMATIRVTEVAVNQGVDDALFDVSSLQQQPEEQASPFGSMMRGLMRKNR